MLKLKTHQYYWLSCFLLLILWVISYYSEDILDINVHDTYYVIHYTGIIEILFLLYASLGFIYLAFYKFNIKLITSLTIIHTVVSIGSVLIYFLGLKLINLFSPKTDFPLFNDLSNENVFVTILFLFAFIAQLLFILNILISSIKYAIQRTTSK